MEEKTRRKKLHALKPKMMEILEDLLVEDGREESGRALTMEERRMVKKYLDETATMYYEVIRERVHEAEKDQQRK